MGLKSILKTVIGAAEKPPEEIKKAAEVTGSEAKKVVKFVAGDKQ